MEKRKLLSKNAKERLKPTTHNIEKVVLLYDTHIPYNVNLDPIFHFISDYRPDTIILGGDMHDWTSVCTWISDQSRVLDGGTISQNYDQLNNVLIGPLLTTWSPNTKLVYLEGNHEYWLHQATTYAPNGRGYWELGRNIDKRVNVIPINVPYKLSDHLYAIHGTYVNDAHSKKTAMSYHKTMMYGHAHTMQSYTVVSPIDSKILYRGQCCGCLCQRNPLYMRNKPNAWVLGFNYVEIERETGFFWDHPTHIIDGRFIANEKVYK